jgi:hypothetical protein
MRHTSFAKLGGTFALVLIALVGWRIVGHVKQYRSWSEEVKLHDGRLVVVKQKHRYFENHGTVESWVTFSLPELGGERTWHSYLKPMRLDTHEGKVYVFGRPRGSKQVMYYRLPKHFMVAFEWKDDEGFVRIPFLEVPQPLRVEENIFPCIPSRTSMLTLESKEKQWCAPSGEKQQFTKEINLLEYEALAAGHARLLNTEPLTE